MDRRLKERLVGATILVALIVAIVPEFLSGPKRTSPEPAPATLSAPTRTVTVDLATSKALGSPGGEPPRAATPPSSASAAGAPPPPAQESKLPAAAAPPLESDASSPKSSVKSGASAGAASGGTGQHGAGSSTWAVQLGVFASRANAEKLVQQLRSSGSAVYVISSGSGPTLRYRVRMGPMADRGAAERAVEKLKGEGHAATIVTPSS